VVEESASPKGGYPAFYKFVGEKIKYPAQARRMGVEGKVFVEFVVNRDGSIVDVKAIKGIGAGCDEEAVRIVQSAPAWTPGKQRGKPVRQKMVIPITFKLG
jgi:protein TonB